MLNDYSITFSATLWRYDGKAAWYFISLPKKEAQQIREIAGHHRSAWGSIRVVVAIGGTQWKTSLFPDRKSGTYLLPVKAAVRRAETLEAGESVSVVVTVDL